MPKPFTRKSDALSEPGEAFGRCTRPFSKETFRISELAPACCDKRPAGYALRSDQTIKKEKATFSFCLLFVSWGPAGGEFICPDGGGLEKNHGRI
jgi:hypothetical protein